MNSKQLRKLLTDNGYVLREQFGELVGVVPGSDFANRCEKMGINVLRCRMNGETEWQYFPATDAHKYRARQKPVKQEKNEQKLPLIAYAEKSIQADRAKMKAEIMAAIMAELKVLQ